MPPAGLEPAARYAPLAAKAQNLDKPIEVPVVVQHADTSAGTVSPRLAPYPEAA